jgi:hypothetical protein
MTEQPQNASQNTSEDISEQIGTDPSQSGGMDETTGGFDDNTGGESYHGYSVDDEDQPQSTHDSLTDGDRVAEPLDEGYSPPEKWSAGEGYGNTPLEEELGETLDQRLAQEVPDPDPYRAAGSRGEDVSGEVGDARTGRLVDEDGGLGEDTEKDLVADDTGVDGAGASAEEAAVHTIDE